MKLGKVVFLDIDGVLNSSRFFGERKESDDGLIPNTVAWQRMIDPEAVKVLNEILERSGAVVVLSSSWRNMLKFEDVQIALEARGFKGKIVDATPSRSPVPPYRRGNEIQAWLNDNQVDAFVILDDDGDMEHLAHKLVQTNPIEGLGPVHIPLAMAHLDAAAPALEAAYDLEAVYDAEIAPLMKQIIKKCKQHHLPLIASFQYAVVPENVDEGYCTTYLDWPERRAHRLHRALQVIRPPGPPWLALAITGAQKAKSG